MQGTGNCCATNPTHQQSEICEDILHLKLVARGAHSTPRYIDLVIELLTSTLNGIFPYTNMIPSAVVVP